MAPVPKPTESRQLAGIYRHLRTMPRFISQLLNPQPVFLNADTIEFDVGESGTGMAPFVRSNAPGIPTRGSGSVTKRYRPAYIKMRDGINVADNQPMWYIGERVPWNMLSYQQKFNLTRADIIRRHSEMKEVREEWMNAQLLRSASYSVKFQGNSGQVEDTYPIDFGRDPALTVTPATLWSAAGAKPVEDLEGWFQTIADIYEGNITDVVMGKDVPKHLVLQEQMNNLDSANSRILAQNFDTARLTYTDQDAVREYGTYRGVRYTSYTGRYHDATGARQYFIAPNELVVVARKQTIGTALMLRGRIRDIATLDQNIDLFQKEWKVEDPSGITILSQASPLAATVDANFALRATVL